MFAGLRYLDLLCQLGKTGKIRQLHIEVFVMEELWLR